jgi:hypothetical protein
MSNNKVNASPTKEFFIEMITKDISIETAIAELVDNSIDSATRNNSDNIYKDTSIDITINGNGFIIEDNCAGMTLEVAQNYAFRFGRPKENFRTEFSIGRFGVGMKRALFKIGKNFYIKSTTKDSEFEIHINSDEWSEDDSWDFEFSKQLHDNFKITGTKIEINNLHNSVGERFQLKNFIEKIIQDLSEKNAFFIERGLTIRVNGHRIEASIPSILKSEHIMPAYYEETINGVQVRIICGIGDMNSPKKAGWYLYCNDRQIIAHDQSFLTGWGTETGIPYFHNDYARFRGYMLFNSNNPEQLPWNTTKTSIDIDNETYIYTLTKVKKIMKSNIQFIKKINKERDAEEQPLIELINNADKVKIIHESIINHRSTTITYPETKNINLTERKISYSKPIEQIERVKDVLGTTSLKELGERTFDYFYEMECEE